MALGAYGWSRTSLGGSFSHNAPINVSRLATVTVQFVQAIINRPYCSRMKAGQLKKIYTERVHSVAVSKSCVQKD